MILLANQNNFNMQFINRTPTLKHPPISHHSTFQQHSIPILKSRLEPPRSHLSPASGPLQRQVPTPLRPPRITTNSRNPPLSETMEVPFIQKQWHPSPPHCQYQLHNTTVEEAEGFIDDLLTRKLRLLVKMNKDRLKRRGNSQRIDDNIASKLGLLDMQIKSLVSSIKTSMVRENGTSSPETWSQLDRKIKMLEKMLAENSSEGEVMKKFYTRVSHSSSYNNFCQQRGKSRIDCTENSGAALGGRESNKNDIQCRMPSVSCNKYEYKIPNSEAYERFRYRGDKTTTNADDKYIINTSAYNKSYQPYPHHPMAGFTKKPESLPFEPYTGKVSSSYMNHYSVPKPVPRTDYKELDCYRNKLKSVNLDYSRRIKSENKESIAEYALLQQVPQKARTENSLMSQSRTMESRVSEYSNPEDLLLYRGTPKNRNLLRLKHCFNRIINQYNPSNV